MIQKTSAKEISSFEFLVLLTVFKQKKQEVFDIEKAGIYSFMNEIEVGSKISVSYSIAKEI